MNALCLLASVAVTVIPNEGPIRLSPGMQDTLRQQGITRVAIAKTDLVDVTTTGPGELLFTGKARGRTNITLWYKSGRVVTRPVIIEDERQGDLERLIHDKVNPVLEISRVGERTIIDGKLDSMEELYRLKKLVGDDPNVVILAKMNPAVLPFLAEQITQAFRRSGIREATATAVGGRIILEGSVADDAELKKAQVIADAYYAGWQGGAR